MFILRSSWEKGNNIKDEIICSNFSKWNFLTWPFLLQFSVFHQLSLLTGKICILKIWEFFRPLPPMELDYWIRDLPPFTPDLKKEKLHNHLNNFRHFIGDDDIHRNHPQFFFWNSKKINLLDRRETFAGHFELKWSESNASWDKLNGREWTFQFRDVGSARWNLA